jgi:hypothetical protein
MPFVLFLRCPPYAVLEVETKNPRPRGNAQHADGHLSSALSSDKQCSRRGRAVGVEAQEC